MRQSPFREDQDVERCPGCGRLIAMPCRACLADAIKLPRAKRNGGGRLATDPTPAEIAQRKAAVRAEGKVIGITPRPYRAAIREVSVNDVQRWRTSFD